MTWKTKKTVELITLLSKLVVDHDLDPVIEIRSREIEKRMESTETVLIDQTVKRKFIKSTRRVKIVSENHVKQTSVPIPLTKMSKKMLKSIKILTVRNLLRLQKLLLKMV